MECREVGSGAGGREGGIRHIDCLRKLFEAVIYRCEVS